MKENELVLAGNAATSEAARRRAWAQKREEDYKALVRSFEPVEGNPLVTPYTRFLGVEDKVLEHLYTLRRMDLNDPGGWRMPEIPGMNPELKLRRYQEIMCEHLYHMPRFVNGDGVGLGKAQPLDAKVLTPSGWRLMGDLRIGDKVVDPDGGVGIVEGIYPRGVRDRYVVHTSDGGLTTCCDEHLWTVSEARGEDGSQNFRTFTLRELMDCGFFSMNHGGKWKRNKHFLPIAAPTMFTPRPTHPLSPYVLGALIGDGALGGPSVVLTSADEEILARVRQELPDGVVLNFCARGDGRATYDYRVVDTVGPQRANRVAQCLNALGLRGHKSQTKFIPHDYLYGSLDSRHDLLKGLMDTDGECSESGLAYYHTTSPQLAQDVAELVRSLGGIASVSEPRGKWFTYKGERKVGLPTYAVTVKITFCPFHLTRKVERWKPAMMARAIVGVTPSGAVPMQCIAVSTQRHLYITDDYIVTHNTLSTIAALTRWRNDLRDQGKCLKTIVFTTTSTAYQWESEIRRFSDLKPWVLLDAWKPKDARKKMTGHAARLAQLQKFLDHPTMNVLVCRYSQWLGIRQSLGQAESRDGTPCEGGKELLSSEMLDFRETVAKVSKQRLALVLDETHRLKNAGVSARNLVVASQHKFGRVIAMTATPIQNRLDEFYSIAAAIGVSPLLGLNHFIQNACVTEKIWTRGGSKTKIIGYHPPAVKKFRVAMRPWYLGRTQAQVKEPMPKLSTVLHPVSLDKATMKLLLEDIPSGTFPLPPALKKVCGEMVWVERDPSNLMTSLSVMSLAANSTALLDPANLKTYLSPKLSPKEELFLDLLDNVYEGEYVIAFSKYRQQIDRLEHLTKVQGRFTSRKFLRITGAEKGSTREEMRLHFQNEEEPDYNFIMINTAAIEGVNLQRAAHMICLDLPWSWGALIQLVGRMVRMASPNAACMLHILYALGTIDEYVLEVLKSKKGVFERILGTSGTQGLLDDAADLDLDAVLTGMEDESDQEFYDMMRAHAKAIGIRPYAFGEILAQERAGMRSSGKSAFDETWLSEVADA